MKKIDVSKAIQRPVKQVAEKPKKIVRENQDWIENEEANSRSSRR